MKTIQLWLILSLLCNAAYSQQTWFRLYEDSLTLTIDGNSISESFKADINKIDPDLTFEVKTILNTTPGLIYYYDKTVNLPLWEQVLPELKGFFYELAGGEADGKRVFELFFNGFYLPHELAHGLQDSKEGTIAGSYKNEHFANTVAMLWWRKQGNTSELKACYDYATKMLAKLPNPLPQNQTMDQYYTANYDEAIQNPYNYGFLQFSQFVEIYEDTNLTDFDTFVKSYLSR